MLASLSQAKIIKISYNIIVFHCPTGSLIALSTSSESGPTRAMLATNRLDSHVATTSAGSI